MKTRFLGMLLAVGLMANAAYAGLFYAESAERKTTLIEMFSSEGCSSCPPAEAWASTLTGAGGLWRDFVPVVFHVHYWDNLGWKDRFASPAFTQRQNEYVQSWNESTLYTPGLVLNGRPWEGWRRAKSIPRADEKPGILKIEEQKDGSYKIRFKTSAGFEGQAHAALLGFGIAVNVTRGENAGRTLDHDFTVLDFQSKPLEGRALSAVFRFDPEKFTAPRFGMAVWVTAAGDVKPVQAVGGYLFIKDFT